MFRLTFKRVAFQFSIGTLIFLLGLYFVTSFEVGTVEEETGNWLLLFGSILVIFRAVLPLIYTKFFTTKVGEKVLSFSNPSSLGMLIFSELMIIRSKK